MTAALSASRARQWGRLAVAFSLAISLVAIPAVPAQAVTDTYGDYFSFGFSGSSGSLPWATDWIETGEFDGPSAGAILVWLEPNCPGGGLDACLIIGKGGPADVSAEREVDLSRASTATLAFSMDRHQHPGTHGTVELSVSGNGGTDWTVLDTWDPSLDPGVESQSYDLVGHLSANTRIRFEQFGGLSDSHINIDNVVITVENDLSVYAGGIAINEVLFDQTPADDEEFVEFFNATTGTVSLAGWQLDNRAGFTFYTFPPGTSLASGEYAVVWIGTVDPGGLRDATAAAFQDGANQVSNFLWDNGDGIWLHDDGGLRVDFVGWGTGDPSPPPEWDATFETFLGGAATARGQSISLTPNGIDGNSSACWEPTTSGDAAGRCAGYLATGDSLPLAQLWTPGVSNQGPPINNPPVFDQDLPDRADSEGTLITVSSTATDPDLSDTLTYTATGLPQGISLNAATGALTGALGPNSSGTHPVAITVTDNGIPNEQDVDTFTWTVSAGEVAYLVANTGGGNGGDDLLTAVNLSDPNPATNETDIGTGTGTNDIEAIALQPGTDVLFAVEGDQLGTIDVTSGTFTALPSIVGSGNGPVGLITFDNTESLSFDPFSGNLYGTHGRGEFNEDVLFQINPGTGAIVPAVFGGNDYVPVQHQGTFYHVADLAFDPTDGQLYGVQWDPGWPASIAVIDSATGATSTVGPIPSFVAGLAFDEAGRLWGTTADTPSPHFLYQLDKSDGPLVSTATIDNGGNYEAIAISFPFNPNLPPAFDQDLLDRADPEGTAVSISSAATDPDLADTLLYTATGLPPGLSIDPNGGLISGTISFAATGTYPVAVTVTDDGIPNLPATDTFTWTITEANQAPVFDQDLLDRSDPEGATISLSAGATDPDLGDNLLYGATGLPAGTSIDPGSGLISGTISFTAAGTYPVSITASDDGTPSMNDFDSFTWTVTNTNRPPLVVNPGAQTTPELLFFSLVITASDPDLTIPTFSDGSTLPGWATLLDNLDGTATISGTPGGGDSATTTVTIAADDGFLSDDAVFDLTVTNTNLPPAIVNPGNQVGAENASFSVIITATDPDTTIPSFTDSGLPGWATLTDNGDGAATISGTPGYADAAITTVTITANDGLLTDDAVFDIAIANTNRSPVADPIPDVVGAEGVPLTPVVVTASDPDATIPALSATGLPPWVTFADNLDGTGTITGSPGFTDAATHAVTVTADDGSLTHDAAFTLTVTNTNRPPVVAPIADQTVAETDAFVLIASATDPDLTVPFMNVAGLPGWASFTDNGDGTATVSGTPGYTDAGSSLVTITATDSGALSGTETFMLTVTDTNRPPAVDPISDQTAPENAPFTLTIIASDPDLTNPALTAAGLPTWAIWTDNGDGTATLSGTPGFDDAAVHSITVTADDGALTTDGTFTLTVTNTNRPPAIALIADVTVAEADPLAPVLIAATDDDGDALTLTATGLPGWATLTGTSTITGTPGYDDAGTHLVTITANDGTAATDGTFTLTITNTNRAPVAADDALLVPADAAYTVFSVLVNDSDPDGDAITVVSFGPTGTGTLTDEGAGTFRYVPGSGAPYVETFTYTIEDASGAAATATVFVSVSARAALPPLPPVVVPAIVGLAPLSGVELEPMTFTAALTVEADVSFSLVDAPAGASINPSTGTFAWTPTEAQGPGDFSFVVRIVGAGGTVLDEATIQLTIRESDTAPTLLPQGALAAEPGSSFTTTFSALDPDLPAQTPRFELAGPVPAGAAIDPRTGQLTWEVANDEPLGRTELTVRVRDGSDPSLYDEMTIVVTVGAASSSDRKAALIAQLIAAPDSPRDLTPNTADAGIQRTLVIMARAGMGSARALGAPFLLLLALTVLVLLVGRISLHPLLGRSRRMEGTVAWYDGASGYGFIIPDRSAGELFLHRSALERGKTDVTPGERVSFRTVKGGHRSFALRVKGIGQ